MAAVRSFVRLAATLCAGIGAAHAQMTLGLTSGVERIENPRLEAVSPGGVTLLRLEPTYSYDVQGDRMRMQFNLGAVIERSSNTALTASREYPSLGYLWTYNWPASMLELRASLTDSATRNTEFRDLGRVVVDTKEREIETGARWEQELTKRTRLALSLTSGRTTFDSGLLAGYREQALTGRFTWEASERVVYYYEPSYRRLLPSGLGLDASQNRWLIGARGELSSEWSVTASAGQARARGDRPSKGTVTELQLAYAGSRATTAINWSRDLATSGTEASYVVAQTFGLNFGYQITERAILRVGYEQSLSDGAARGRGNTISLSLENELSAHWRSTLAFEDRRSRFSEIRSTGRGRSILAGLNYVYPGR
jgi:hypothetical protein